MPLALGEAIGHQETLGRNRHFAGLCRLHPAFIFPEGRSLLIKARSGRGRRRPTDLISKGPGELVFAWDVPVVSTVRPDLLARVGGFFFTRAGQPVSVLSLAPDTNRVKVDANYPIPALLRQEGTQGRGAFIWIYPRVSPRPRWPSSFRQTPPSKDDSRAVTTRLRTGSMLSLRASKPSRKVDQRPSRYKHARQTVIQ